MSQENPNDSDQKTQTPVNSSSSNNLSANRLSTNTDETTSTQDSETHSVDTPVEHSTDNEAPMPPTEPIPSSSGWNPKKKNVLQYRVFYYSHRYRCVSYFICMETPPIHPNRTAYQ